MKYSVFTSILIAALCALTTHAQTLEDCQPCAAPNWEIAVGVGSMELDKGRFGFDDSGMGLNLGVRFSDSSTPVDAEWRLYGTKLSLNDGVYSVPDDPRGGTYDVYCNDGEYTLVGTDLSLLANFNRGGLLNPYVGLGFLYEGSRFEADVYQGNYHYGWPRHPEADWEEHGWTYLMRVGADLRAGLLYARLDASYIGEIYDADDNGQFLLSGDIGAYFCPKVRADVFGHYFTEYKSFYIGVGLTVVL